MSTASPPFFPGIASLALIAVFASACGDEGPLMRPGENCLSCHNRGGKSFTVAGTVFPSATADPGAGTTGAEVVLTDARGTVVRLPTNAVGNFYSKQALTFPLTAELHHGTTVLRMSQPVTSGGCATCHSNPASQGAPGRLYVP